jgi:hypothetical protein
VVFGGVDREGEINERSGRRRRAGGMITNSGGVKRERER